MAHAAQHTPAGLLDEARGIAFQRVAEGIVRGHEEPRGAAVLHAGRGDRLGQRIGVVHPVEAGRRTGRAGEVRRARAGGDVELAVIACIGAHGQRHRGRAQSDDHVDAVLVVPAPRDRRADIGFVLVVGGDHLDLAAEHAAAEILDRHLHGGHARGAGDVGIGARHVVQDADFYGIAGELGLRRHGHRQPGEAGDDEGCDFTHGHGTLRYDVRVRVRSSAGVLRAWGAPPRGCRPAVRAARCAR